MKLRAEHVPYVARKISLDLFNSGVVTFNGGIEGVADMANEILKANILAERAIDEEANKLLDANEADVNVMSIDKREMFWLIKRKLCANKDFTLSYEDRYNALSHEILAAIWKRDLIDYSVSENRVKNIIYQSIENYLKTYEKVEEVVIEKMSNLEKKLLVGSQEYELVFEKLYKDELKKRGMF